MCFWPADSFLIFQYDSQVKEIENIPVVDCKLTLMYQFAFPFRGIQRGWGGAGGTVTPPKMS